MAKARKSKNEEQKNVSSRCVILHQKLCLSIDMEKKKIFGGTELQVLVPKDGPMALCADEMTISSVTIDGEPAKFLHFPRYQYFEDESWSSVSCCKTAADAACSAYLSLLNKEMDPNLLISLSKSSMAASENGHEDNVYIVQNSFAEQVVNGNSVHLEEKNVKHVRINYWIERPEVGIHFGENVMHTNNQIRRACCWFPCVDSISQFCTFDMEYTVDSKYVAVSNGDLLYQVLSRDDPPRKTYVYKLNVPVRAGAISLAVAPFEILPDSHTAIISHMCLSPNLQKLQNTIAFFHQVFSHYEDYLSTSFPFGSYKQIFIPSDASVSSTSIGASMCILTTQLLYDKKVIDQTMETRIKLAYALAKQWFGVYISAEEPTDEWLIDGLAEFLTESFIKKYFGNNEARHRRYKANCTVCNVDVSGATALSSSAASTDLHGTQSIGLYGKFRSWKAVAILQMLEKQMGPDAFRKILQNIAGKVSDTTRSRTLSTKEFNNLALKVGNLERPFLKEFFPSWVESCGCPILRMGLGYMKKKNLVEFAVMRGCTASAKSSSVISSNVNDGTRAGEVGWPGMMSIRVHEIEGMFDHPCLPLNGDTCQLLEIQCHSKLGSKRIIKPKKGSRADGSDDNADTSANLDMRVSMDSPLLWIRVDPDMEYLAEIDLHQPVQMWINQLEKEKDVVAQAQAIAALEKLPQLSFAVVNALNNFLGDSKAFWRVRIEAAYALANTASEDTDYAGLLHLIKFYKSRRFDADVGLPKPNNSHDVPEYFVLKAIPHAIALVKAADKKSPREAVEFVLQLLKNNDNTGNPYSDVFWISALVRSIGEFEFSQQNVSLLSSLLKRIEHVLLFDSLMHSHNGIVTISCIHTLAQIALKFSSSISFEQMAELIKPFCNSQEASWNVRIEATKVLLDLENYSKGLGATLSLFMEFLEKEPSLSGETKLAVHVMRLCQTNEEAGSTVACSTLVALLRLLASKKAFNNISLRHHLFCILQIVAGRPPTLYGIPKLQESSRISSDAAETLSDQQTKPTSIKLRMVPKSLEPSPVPDTTNISSHTPPQIVTDNTNFTPEPGNISDSNDQKRNIEPLVEAAAPTISEQSKPTSIKLKVSSKPPEPLIVSDAPNTSPQLVNDVITPDSISNCSEQKRNAGPRIDSTEIFTEQQSKPTNTLKLKLLKLPETSETNNAKEADNVSNCSERKRNVLKIKFKQPGSSSKVQEPENLADGIRRSVHNNETLDVDPASSVSVDAPNNMDENEPLNNANIVVNRNIEANSCHENDSRMTASMGSIVKLNKDDVDDAGKEKAPISVVGSEEEVTGKRKKEKKRDKKRKRDEKDRNDPEYSERKRQKKEKKRLEKEMAKMKKSAESDVAESSRKAQENDAAGQIVSIKGTSLVPKLKIRIKRNV